MAYTFFADTLIACCGADEFPEGIDCLRAFLFDRVRNEEEASNLLGVYIGMVKCHPRFNRDDLIAALQTNTLASYITSLYQPPYESYYSKWFLDNVSRFL